MPQPVSGRWSLWEGHKAGRHVVVSHRSGGHYVVWPVDDEGSSTQQPFTTDSRDTAHQQAIHYLENGDFE